MFVDSALVQVRAGKGGRGIVSFRRERYITNGGPDGGDGGNGGNIIFIASNNQNTLSSFRINKELKAGDGGNGANAKRHGKAGKDLEVLLPVGTQLSIKNELIVDLKTNGQRELVATGGKGGFGNAHFTSSVRQAPKIAEKGEEGELLEIEMELKIIADVGLVGLPNAGKSTLLSKISSAKPKIANYPFTTLNPHLGVAHISNTQELLVADIPGLIDGASEGKGLGDEFLRHVERTTVLLHLIDAYSEDIASDFITIRNELKNYSINVSSKPYIVAITKIEGLDEDIVNDQIKNLKKVVKDADIYAISALSNKGLKELLYKLSDLVGKQKEIIKAEQEANPEIPVIRAVKKEDSWKVTKKDDYCVVKGRKIERFAARTDFASEDAVRRLRDIMRKMAIIRYFEKNNIQPETKIYFGDNRDDFIEY